MRTIWDGPPLRLETLLANGKRNPVAGIVIAVMIEIDAMETERLSERIMSGLDQARRNGTRLGRPPGTKKAKEELMAAFPGVVKDLKKGRAGGPVEYPSHSRDS